MSKANDGEYGRLTILGLADPDTVGAAEYRAICDCINDALESQDEHSPDESPTELVASMLQEFGEWVDTMQKVVAGDSRVQIGEKGECFMCTQKDVTIVARTSNDEPLCGACHWVDSGEPDDVDKMVEALGPEEAGKALRNLPGMAETLEYIDRQTPKGWDICDYCGRSSDIGRTTADGRKACESVGCQALADKVDEMMTVTFAECKELVLRRGLTLETLINVVVEVNGVCGVGFITLKQMVEGYIDAAEKRKGERSLESWLNE